MVTTVYEHLAHAFGDGANLDHPLGPMTTYGVGGAAALFVEVGSTSELDHLRRVLSGTGVAVCIIGRGSNMLVADAGFDGVAVHLGEAFARMELPESGAEGSRSVVGAGGAVPLPALARQVAKAGWSGLTWAVGVPGSVGGAVRMNAGGHGSDMATVLRSYTWVDLLSEEGGTDGVDRLRYGYRRSSVAPSEVVVHAELAVSPGDAAAEGAELASIVRWRRAHQPGGSNAGSVFTNPAGDAAGRLIEEAGLKGYRLGSAHVSSKHANFIQADNGGKADDVQALMEHVRGAVRNACGVTLATEVRLLGFSANETGAMESDR